MGDRGGETGQLTNQGSLEGYKSCTIVGRDPISIYTKAHLAPLKNISEEAGEREEVKEVVVIGLQECRGDRAGRNQEDWTLNFVAEGDIMGLRRLGARGSEQLGAWI